MTIAPDPADLLACCGSRHWLEIMLGQRPFASPEVLHSAAEIAWLALPEADWLEAFAAHPQIGTRPDDASRHANWSREEQAAIAPIAELGRLNREYFDRFGFIFIVSAAGKSAPEILALLQHRLTNIRNDEINIAAAEQAKIMHLRIDKLLAARQPA